MKFKTLLVPFNAIIRNENGNIGFMGGAGSDSAGSGSDGTSDGSSGGPDDGSGTGDGDASDGAGSQQTFNLPQGVDAELAPMMKPFYNAEGELNISELMKSYAHTKKLVGKDKIVVPDGSTSEEDMRKIYHKLGLPEDIEQYNIKNTLPEDVQVNEALMNGYKQAAHKAGILPNQAQQILDFFNNTVAESSKQQQEEAQRAYDESLNNLKTEWGEGYQKNVDRADLALKHFADEETIKALNQEGVLGSTTLTKLFAKIGSGLKEDNSFNDKATATVGLTPDEIPSKIAEFYDPNTHVGKAFMNKGHKDNKWAKDQFTKLMELKVKYNIK
jgi:hypothetical protein